MKHLQKEFRAQNKTLDKEEDAERNESKVQAVFESSSCKAVPNCALLPRVIELKFILGNLRSQGSYNLKNLEAYKS